MVKVIERGWVGHFICGKDCMFRRNTLIQGKKDSVVVTTVGALRLRDKTVIDTIGANGRYYETMVFGAMEQGKYIEANVSDERRFTSEWAICADSVKELPDDVDNKANDMHDTVVAEFKKIIK